MKTQELEGLPLREFGFVHVTGLSITSRSGSSMRSRCILASDEECGYWSILHKGTTCLVTAKGEVWLAYHDSQTETVLESQEFCKIRDSLCPKGQSKWFFEGKWFGGGDIESGEIMYRVSNPAWNDHAGCFPLVRTTSWDPNSVCVVVEEE